MKFLCEHCKAKYQIADDKVAGRTVRMKCRKCGGSIEVRAEVTETSVATKTSELTEGSGAHATPARPAPAKPAAPPPRPAPRSAGSSQAIRAIGAASPSVKESPLAGAFQRNVQRDEDPTASAGLNLRELSASDEWYVAVNGVPVGPVRVDEVRRKAAIGAVTEDSLCWQEGMEEWRPIRTVTELAAVVREAASAGRTSQQLPADHRASSPPGVPRRPSAPKLAPLKPAAPPTRRDSSARGLPPTAPRRPTPAHLQSTPDDEQPTLIGRSPLLDGGLQDAEPETTPLVPPAPAPPAPRNGAAAFSAGASSDPFKPVAVDPFRPIASPVGPAPQGAADVAAMALMQPAPTYAPGSPPPIVLAAPPSRMSPIAIGVIVMFACFGVMSAYMLLSKPERQPVAVAPFAAPVVPPPIPTPLPNDIPPPVAVNAPTPGDSAGAAPVADAGPPPVAVATPRGGGNPTGARGGTARPGPNGAANPDLRALLESSGTGPSPTAGGGGGGGGGPQLGSDDVQRVVSQHSLAVKRTCWDRTSSTVSSVNETVHIVIAGSGQVTSTSATGNDPVVGHCLEDEIRRWRWPGGGEVNVPFHFLRQ